MNDELVFFMIAAAISAFMALLKLAGVIAISWIWVVLPLIIVSGVILFDLDGTCG